MLDLGRLDHDIHAPRDFIGRISRCGRLIGPAHRGFDLGTEPKVVVVRVLLGGEPGNDRVEFCGHGFKTRTGTNHRKDGTSAAPDEVLPWKKLQKRPVAGVRIRDSWSSSARFREFICVKFPMGTLSQPLTAVVDLRDSGSSYA